MKRVMSLALSAVIGTTLTACGPSGSLQAPSSAATPQKTQLIGQELMSVVTGKTYAWIRARDQATGETTFANDGSMAWKRLDVTSSGKGAWQVNGENLCQTFDPTPTWKGGKVCRKIFRTGTTLTTSLNDGGLVTYTPTTGS